MPYCILRYLLYLTTPSPPFPLPGQGHLDQVCKEKLESQAQVEKLLGERARLELECQHLSDTLAESLDQLNDTKSSSSAANTTSEICTKVGGWGRRVDGWGRRGLTPPDLGCAPRWVGGARGWVVEARGLMPSDLRVVHQGRWVGQGGLVCIWGRGLVC